MKNTAYIETAKLIISQEGNCLGMKCQECFLGEEICDEKALNVMVMKQYLKENTNDNNNW